LIVIGSIPFIGSYAGIVGLVGLVLLLIAMKELSTFYGERGIFNYALYGVILAVIGIVVFAVIMVTAAFGLIASLGIDFEQWSDFAKLGTVNWQNIANLNLIWPFITIILVDLVILFVFIVVSAIFFRRSFNILREKTGVGMFGTAGLVLLIGAVMTVILIGLLVIWVSMILLTIAFFSIKPPTTSPTVQQSI